MLWQDTADSEQFLPNEIIENKKKTLKSEFFTNDVDI